MGLRKIRRMRRIVRKTIGKINDLSSQSLENMETQEGSLESKYKKGDNMEPSNSSYNRRRVPVDYWEEEEEDAYTPEQLKRLEDYRPDPIHRDSRFRRELKDRGERKVQLDDREVIIQEWRVDRPNPKFQWRNFIFVKYNWKPEDEEKLRQLFKHAYAVYIIWGREICPKTNTPHLQGYCELESRMTFNPLIELLPSGIHLEQRRGSQKQAIDYCKKDGDWEDHGIPRKQGSRSDMDIVKKNLAEGKRIIDLLTNSDEDMTMSIVKGVEQLQKYYSTRR